MIVDPTASNTSMVKDNDYDSEEQHGVPQQAPPSYDAAVRENAPFVPESATKGRDVKVPPFLPHPSSYQPGGSSAGPSGSVEHVGGTVVYNYVNPTTGERVVSLLPPDHPQMLCLQEGGHVTATKYGLLGILAAVLWFPLGIGLCLLDRKVYCRRCGAMIDDGMC